VGAVRGHRVHRSHWVAEDAIRETLRRDGRVFLTMTDGAEIPVSRSYQKALREAGLL
jgi:DNA-binding LytR/AlgR family response regulator